MEDSCQKCYEYNKAITGLAEQPAVSDMICGPYGGECQQGWRKIVEGIVNQHERGVVVPREEQYAAYPHRHEKERAD